MWLRNEESSEWLKIYASRCALEAERWFAKLIAVWQMSGVYANAVANWKEAFTYANWGSADTTVTGDGGSLVGDLRSAVAAPVIGCYNALSPAIIGLGVAGVACICLAVLFVQSD